MFQDYGIIVTDIMGNLLAVVVQSANIEYTELVNAKHSIPYHMAPGEPFSRESADQFSVQSRLIVVDGEEITIE